jgi:CelD/BcsL family acetyltransferase involved in cellulose biosynthesis
LLQVDLVRPDALSDAERRAWAAFAAATPAFASPLLSAGFAELVGGVREDLVVAVVRREGEIVGFLPHHRRPFRFGRPVGAPFSDYHAFVSRPHPAVEAEALLAGMGLSSFRFTGLIDPYGVFAKADAEHSPSLQIAFDGEGADYLEALRAGSPKRFKNLRRLVHKLEREVGELTVVAPHRDRDDFDRLLAWKRQQLQRTGLHDVLGAAWTQGLMDAAFARTEGDLTGLLIGLKIGDRLVAGHFGVRQGDRYHPWIAAHDPALAAYSPGTVFLWKAIEAMRGLGLSVYDLSGGHDHYKRPFASGLVEVAAGTARRGPALPSPRQSALVRLHRRMDQIAAVELSLGGRLQGLATAVAAQGRRRADLDRIGAASDE